MPGSACSCWPGFRDRRSGQGRGDLLAISEDNRWLYGMSPQEEAIVVIDVGSNRVVGTILTRSPAPPAPDGL